MKIIGLTGAAGSGKDTVCGFALEWCKEHHINAERLAFADPLKVSAAAALGLNTAGGETGVSVSNAVAFCDRLKAGGVIAVYDVDGSTRTVLTGREFLQCYGTEAHRNIFGDDFWVEVMERKLAGRAGTDLDIVFITDCRFLNEAAMVHKHDGEVWEVVRSGAAVVAAHSSEAGLPDGAIEFQIRNEGSLEDLRTLVGSVCESNLEEVA